VNQFDNDIRAKSAQRDRLAGDVDAFLAKGGQIERPGTQSPSKLMTVREYSDLTWARRNEQ
jgi:hypothetical protein